VVPSENGVQKTFDVVTVTNLRTKIVGSSTGAALEKGTLLAIVYFATDKDVLTAKSKATLNKLSNDLLALGLRDVSLTGHTDTRASGTYNRALSSRRANKVEGYLDGKVLDAVVEKSWSGESELAVLTADEVDAAKNRRVEIRVR
jgi:outer membrane protein OmpA-like peptidoglycan-associated protein